MTSAIILTITNKSPNYLNDQLAFMERFKDLTHAQTIYTMYEDNGAYIIEPDDNDEEETYETLKEYGEDIKYFGSLAGIQIDVARIEVD